MGRLPVKAGKGEKMRIKITTDSENYYYNNTEEISWEEILRIIRAWGKGEKDEM